LGLLQKGQHQFKGGNPHRHIQGLDHEPGRPVAVTSGQQQLPEIPPALIREEVALVAAMEQGPGLGPQAIDQMLQIDAPGPLLTCGAIGAWELADPVAAQKHHQPVVVQPHRDLAADQGGRHGVNDLPHLDRAGAAHPHREQLVIGKAEGRQGSEMLEFLLVAPLPGGVESAEHLNQQLAVFGRLHEIAAAAQDQLLLQPPFHMAVVTLDDAVLMGHAAVVAAGGQAVVRAQGLVAGGDVEGIAAVSVAAGSRKPIGTQLFGHPAAGSQAVLQAF
jgi:hypothetical protein